MIESRRCPSPAGPSTIESVAVGASVGDRRRHPAEQVAVGRLAVAVHESGDAAHGRGCPLARGASSRKGPMKIRLNDRASGGKGRIGRACLSGYAVPVASTSRLPRPIGEPFHENRDRRRPGLRRPRGRPRARASRSWSARRRTRRSRRSWRRSRPTRIEATVRKLVSFGTRHTLSDPDNPTRGIGAARRWIKAELESYAKESGGRLIVEEDSFVQPVGAAGPEADHPGQPGGHPARRSAGLARPLARRQRALRLDPPADVRHRDRRPGRQRRRLGHGGLDGAGPGDVEIPLRRHARLPGRPRRGARLARRDPLGREGEGRGAEHRGDADRRHRRQHPRRQRRPRQPPGPRLLRRRPRHRDRGPGPGPPDRRRRERRPVPPARPLHQGGRRALRPRLRGHPRLPPRPLRPRAATTSRSTSEGSPPSA